MTDAERRETARQFINKWNGKGNEDQDSQKFWFDFLSGIVGMDNITDRVEFEKKVIVDGHSKKIDVYIPKTHVLIEQKSLGKDLDKKLSNSGDISLTPYEQAKRYNDNLPYDEKARWIITSNFSEIWVYDMNMAVPEPIKIKLSELQTKFPAFDFMTDKAQKKISQEMEVSVKAGEFVGLIYDALHKQYINPESEQAQKSLNMLCVRLVFCLYAEDAHIFGSSGHMFHDYMQQYEPKDMRKALIELFKILDTPEDKRDPYDSSDLSKFPYVNGGLFAKEDIEIPNFTNEIKDILLAKASETFDWSMISPTIFGAVFESTLNPETRRSGGMHYTSIENIHKVIDPLFLDELTAEYNEIDSIQVERSKKQKLESFQNKLAGFRWLDPACGSGNFLTETYISIRRLENRVIRAILDCDRKQVDGQLVFGGIGAINPIKVSINQFYGIEINDFAVTVAKTALWIAESQMMKETEDIIHMSLDFLPLTTNANIVEGNALQMEWESVIPRDRLNYLMGNPPFVGYSLQTKEQKSDILSVFVDTNGKPYSTAGEVDYVAGWFFKAAQLMLNTEIKAAFVSTNSVTQGEQVANIWKPIFERFNIHFDFAYKTFIWDSEASVKAHVHCVIIGFSSSTKNQEIYLYTGDDRKTVSSLNAYLLEAPDIFIDNRSKPLCNVPEMTNGSKPADGGFLLLTPEERTDILSKDPEAMSFIRRIYGATEFINNKERYCIWLKNVSPSVYRKNTEIMERIANVKSFRLASTKEATQKSAEYPTLFQQIRQPESSYIIVPRVSSENRRYIPIGFMTPECIASDSVQFIPNAELFEFGVLTSNVHMAWMRAICGRLKSDYRYSAKIVYNNFPWPDLNDEQKKSIEQTAQTILDARELYFDSSLADLYDPLTMPPELQKAHQQNDIAVMKAYGFYGKNMSEADCVAELMKMYQSLVQA